MRPGISAVRTAVALAGIALLLFAAAGPAVADIYRWEDETGALHFTDDLSSIPEKYRKKAQDVQKTPPRGGTVSTIGGAVSSPAPAAPSSPAGAGSTSTEPPRDPPGVQAEQLRAKIAAKEQFLSKVDNKRSYILNPLGNRFVSPEDLELYKKYSEELPADRERLREIEAGLPPEVRVN